MRPRRLLATTLAMLPRVGRNAEHQLMVGAAEHSVPLT